MEPGAAAGSQSQTSILGCVCRYAQRLHPVRTPREDGVCRLRREAQGKLCCCTWVSDFSLQDRGKTHFCHLSPPVYGSLRQPPVPPPWGVRHLPRALMTLWPLNSKKKTPPHRPSFPQGTANEGQNVCGVNGEGPLARGALSLGERRELCFER